MFSIRLVFSVSLLLLIRIPLQWCEKRAVILNFQTGKLSLRESQTMLLETWKLLAKSPSHKNLTLDFDLRMSVLPEGDGLVTFPYPLNLEFVSWFQVSLSL